MIREFVIEETTVKYDRAARSWVVAIGGDSSLIRYLFEAESEARSPFGALEKFLLENRLDAVLAMAAMYCDARHKELLEVKDESELEEPKQKRNYKRRNKDNTEEIEIG